MVRRINKGWVSLISLTLAIKVFSWFPLAVERYYSNGIYPMISRLQRFLFGWLPFSIGDIFYLIAGIWLLVRMYRFFKKVFSPQRSWSLVVTAMRKLVFGLLLLYVVFNLGWGLNYNRVPITERLGLKPEKYSTASLRQLVDLLVLRLNAYDSSGRPFLPQMDKKRYLFNGAKEAYRVAAMKEPFLTYSPSSVKPSIFSYAGNYLGFTGYYNPFSGEAQTNTTVPLFLQPFTTCHEIGHQLGYAKENEANFAGFLSAKNSPNPGFQYSLYFDLFTYAIRELRVRDSLQVKLVREQLKPRVLEDFKVLQSFYRKYENPLEPVIRVLYGKFLKANQQPQGMRSYNEVVAMIVAYYKQHGDL